MLIIRLLLVGGEDTPKQEIIRALHQAQDTENQSTSNSSDVRASGPLRICDKKVKIEKLLSSQVMENLKSEDARYWSKIRGIVFLQDQSDPISSVEFIVQQLKEKNYSAKYNYSMVMFENGKSKHQQFCDDHSITSYSLSFQKIGTRKEKLINESFEKLVAEIVRKNKEMPQRLRRKSSTRGPVRANDGVSQGLNDGIDAIPLRRVSLIASDENEVTIRSGIPSATSEQVAQILSDPNTTGKKKKTRRKSFLTNLKSAGKKKKQRRESLLEDGADGATDPNESDDSGYSSGNSSCIEEMDGFFQLEQLLDFMIFSSSSSRESVIDSVLTCLPSIMSPISFARQLIIRWDTNVKDPKALPILRNRIIAILRIWLDVATFNGFSKECNMLLDKFMNNCVMSNKYLTGTDELLSQWEKCKNFSHQVSNKSQDVTNPLLSPRPPRSESSIGMESAEESISVSTRFTPLEVASQLTLIEHKRFQRISMVELMDANWTLKNRDELAPNLLHMIHHSTFVTLWVQTMILSESDVKERARVVRWLINVAQKCKELANYNSVMAIIGGLQSCAIDRLKKTWEEVGLKNRRKVDQLFNLMVRENYKEYRGIIKSCSGPCVPFPGMWLSDLQFIESGNIWMKKSAENSSNVAINLTKVAMVSKIVNEFSRFQKSSYGLQENEELQTLLRSPSTVDDELAYSISIELEPIVTDAERAEHKRILNGDYIDVTKAQKFESRASELKKHPQEILELVERWNRKMRDDYVMKETFCYSDALEILLIKLCGIDMETFPQNIQRELHLRLHQLFSHCLVGDSHKHEQLMECLRRLQTMKPNEADHLSRRLIRCFKIPPKYRQLSFRLSETQDEISKTREQIEVLEQQLFVADKDHKEHQVQRKRLDNQLKIVKLQERKAELIRQKDKKKIKILSEFNSISSDIRGKLSGASNQANASEWTNELITLSKNMKGTENEYITEKKKFLAKREDIKQQKEPLEAERRRLMAQLQAVEKRITRLDQKQTDLEANWASYQSHFSTSKRTLVAKTDDLMHLIDDVDQKNKFASYLHACMQDFHSFFSSVLNLQQEETNEDGDIQVTKQQQEQSSITTRDTKRYLQSLLQYIKYFEHATFTLQQEWNKNDETLSAIIKLQLNTDVLHREFPQYFDLLDKSKAIRKELIRLKKEFCNVEKQKLWEDEFMAAGLDEAMRCSKSLTSVRKGISELESQISHSNY